MENLSLIDVSSEDDLLISSSSEGLPNLQSSGLSEKSDEHCYTGLQLDSVHERENPVKCSKQVEQVPEFSVSPEPKKTTSGKYNLRKSLAWDNAFFTSEGVLNPEELSIVNSTFRKAEARVLPGILEDTRKSSESTSTLDSDCLSLENLEVDLFENLRASIQKSYGKCNKASGLAHSSKIIAPGELDACLGSSKKVELSSLNKVKIPIGLRKHGMSKRQPEETSKEAPVCVQMAATGGGDLKSSLKPPRIQSRTTPLPTAPSKKSSASGSTQIKSNIARALPGNLGNRQSVVALKKIIHGDSCSVTPRSNPLPRCSSSLSSSSKVLSTTSSVSYSSSSSTSSDSTCKSPLETLRKRSNLRNIVHSSSGSAVKTPLRTSKSKNGSRNASDLPACTKSTFKLSSSVSPNSSIDSVASESSSSTSTMKNPSKSTESLDVGSSSSLTNPSVNGVPRPSDLRKLSTGQPNIRHSNSGALLQSQPIIKVSSGARKLADVSSVDNSKGCINSSFGAKCFKPSGLRMPSPKIGYFDVDKSLAHNSNRYSQTGLPVNLTKHTSGISNIVGANKLKPSKLQSARPVTHNVAMKFDSPHAGSAARLSSNNSMRPLSPASLHQLSNPSEVSSMLRAPENDIDCCSEVNKDFSPSTNEDCNLKVLNSTVEVAEPEIFNDCCSKVIEVFSPSTNEDCNLKALNSTVEVADAADSGQLSNLTSEEHTNQHHPKSSTTNSTQGYESLISSERSSDLTSENSQKSAQIGEDNMSEQSSSMSYIQEGHMENNFHFITKSIEKENLFHSADQSDLLCRHLKTGNLDLAMVELMGEKVSSLCLSERKDMNVCGDSESSHSGDPVGQDHKSDFLQSSLKPILLNSKVEVADAAECGQLSNLTPEEHSNQHHPKSSTTNSTQGYESLISSERNSDLTSKNTQKSAQIGEDNMSEQSSSMSYIQEGHMENNFHFIPEIFEKENLFHSADESDILRRHLKTGNLDLAMVELMGEKVASLCLSEIKDMNVHGDSESSHSGDPIGQNQKSNFVQSSLKPILLSISPTVMDLRPSARTPLADNYSMSNSSKSTNSVTEFTEKLVGKTCFSEIGLPNAIGSAAPEIKLGQVNAIQNSFFEEVLKSRDSDSATHCSF